MVKPDELRVEDNLKVVYVAGDVRYYQITSIDDLKYPDAHSALATGATESFAEITNLNPPIGQLYWIGKLEVDGNLKIYLKQPAATNRWGTNRSPQGGYVHDGVSSIGDGADVDIWIAQDFPPNIQMVNGTNITITATLWWYGKRFGVKELKAAPSVYSRIRIGGISD